MTIIVFAIIVLIVAALFFCAVAQIDSLKPPFKGLIQALILVLAALIIADRAGLL
jgi:hypothetical protein